MGAAAWDGFSLGWDSQLLPAPAVPLGIAVGLFHLKFLFPESPLPWLFPSTGHFPSLSCSCPLIWLCLFLGQIRCVKIIPVALRPLVGEPLREGGNKSGRLLNSSVSCGSCLDGLHLSSWPCPVLGGFGCGMSRGFGTLVFLYSHQYSCFSRDLSLMESVFSFSLAWEGISAEFDPPQMKPSLAVSW